MTDNQQKINGEQIIPETRTRTETPAPVIKPTTTIITTAKTPAPVLHSATAARTETPAPVINKAVNVETNISVKKK